MPNCGSPCSYSNDILGEGNIYWCDECDRVAVKEEYIKDYAKKYKKKCAVNLRNGKFICVNCFNKKINNYPYIIYG